MTRAVVFWQTFMNLEEYGYCTTMIGMTLITLVIILILLKHSKLIWDWMSLLSSALLTFNFVVILLEKIN